MMVENRMGGGGGYLQNFQESQRPEGPTHNAHDLVVM